MQNKLSRRTLVTGAAWAAPVVVASSAIPAFASSREDPCVKDRTFNSQHYSKSPRGFTTEKVIDTWVVPNNVTDIKFIVRGAAGGSLNSYGGQSSGYGGAGAEVSGYLEVTPGETLTFVVGAAGSASFGGSPAEGGQGFGNGGSANNTNGISEGALQWINEKKSIRVMSNQGASGGGASALLRMNNDGSIKQVIAIAGGGGGSGYSFGYADTDYPASPTYTARMAAPRSQANGGMQTVESAEEVGGHKISVVKRVTSTSGSNETANLESFRNFTQTVYGGSGSSPSAEAGSTGNGGAGGKFPTVRPAVSSDDLTFATIGQGPGYYLSGDENGDVMSSAFSGESGEDTSDPTQPASGGNGVPVWAAVHTNDTYYPDDYAESKVNYYIYGTSSGGGGGYGGGGSGSAIAQGVRIRKEEFEFEKGNEFELDNGHNFRYSGAFASLGAGGAGGSYMAPGIENWDGRKFWAHNNRTFGVDDLNGHGRIKVIWCDPTGPHKDYPDDAVTPGTDNDENNNEGSAV